jgi:integrase
LEVATANFLAAALGLSSIVILSILPEKTKGISHLPLQQTEQWLQNFAGLSVSLGTRRGELLLARWEDVDLTRREIRLRHTKNGKERPAFINEAALLVLASMSDGRLKGRRLLFPDVTPAQVTAAFIRACKNVSITDFSLHDLRHTYASLARMNGVDLREFSKILGRSDLRMTDSYAHLSGAHLLDAAKKLDGVLAQAQAEAQRASLGLALFSARNALSRANAGHSCQPFANGPDA